MDRENAAVTAPAHVARWWAWATAAVLALCYGTFIYRTSWVSDGHRRFTLFDDAMVSMTYARTLAEGGGWGWYPGAAPVEGYSNPLWMLVMAVAHLLPGGDRFAPLIVMLIGAGVLGGCVAVATRVARLLGATGPSVVAVCGLLVGLSYPLVFWTLRGMEVGLVALEAVALVWALLAWDVDRERRAVALVVGIAALGVFTRLDDGVLAAAAVVWVVLARVDRRWVKAGAVVGGVVASLAVQTVFRPVVFDAVVPNTYTLKLGDAELPARLSRGGLALGVFVLTSALPALGLAVLALRWTAGTVRRALVLPLVMVAALALYGVWVGGDVWEESLIASRFLAGGLALLVLPGIVAVSMAANGTFGRRIALVATLLGTALAGWSAALALRTHVEDLGIDPDLASAALWSTIGAATVAAVVLAGAALATSRHRPRLATAVLLAAAATVVVNGLGLQRWQASAGGHLVERDQLAADFGRMLGEVTEPGARIAVVWAGAPAYWSRRPTVDLLGKADPVVAASDPHTEYPFRPGHMKWDYTYSIEELRPDVVAQGWLPDPDQHFYLTDIGYELVRPVGFERDFATEWAYALGPPGLWVLRDSPNIRWDRVEVVP